MPTHTIEQGECLFSLAAQYGIPCKDLHDHPQNAALKKKRPHAGILAPGDIVFIPPRKTKSESVATDSRHKFVVTLPKVKLRLVMRDRQGKPYGGKKFIVTVDGKETKGSTTGSGLIEVDIPATARKGRLQVWFSEDPDDPAPHVDRELELGHLDPVDTLSGVQARLNNLGYRCSDDGHADLATVGAVRAFRAKVGLPEVEEPEPPPDGDERAHVAATLAKLLDDDVRQKLASQHEGEA